MDFQKALLDAGLDFEQTNTLGNRFIMRRNKPGKLQVIIEAANPAMTNVNITAPEPSGDIEMFTQEADAVMRAYKQTWNHNQYQVVRSMAKIHQLYSSSEHALKYLWEDRLGCSPMEFKALGQRPVAGGGIRLVLPPVENPDSEPHSIELRIESFLREKNKLFIETAMVWPKASVIKGQEDFSSRGRLRYLSNYAANEVLNFLNQ